MPPVELSWLEDFVALAEIENFSRAAEVRNITQPAFSRRIRALEEWIGTPLFDRATHRVKLTEAGRQFTPVATETLRRLYQGREAARETGSNEASLLLFAATHALSFAFFPQWLSALSEKADIGHVQLISDSMQDCEQVLANGKAHFLLCHFHRVVPNQLNEGLFTSLIVGYDTLVLVAHPELAAGAEGNPSARPYLAYSLASGLGRIVAGTAGGRAQPRPVFTSHLAAVLHTMARKGRGAAWLPLCLIGDDLRAGRLVAIGPASDNIATEIKLFRPRARLSAQAEAFWNLASTWAATRDDSGAADPGPNTVTAGLAHPMR